MVESGLDWGRHNYRAGRQKVNQFNKLNLYTITGGKESADYGVNELRRMF